MTIVYRVRKTDAPTPWFAVEWRASGTAAWHIIDHLRSEAAARKLALERRRETNGRLESRTKRNSTTIVIVGGGKRRNPARDKRGRFVKRRR